MGFFRPSSIESRFDLLLTIQVQPIKVIARPKLSLRPKKSQVYVLDQWFSTYVQFSVGNIVWLESNIRIP